VPKVSVGVPVYNGAQYLAQSLESILAQTYEDFDLLISDNGSTDDTEAICREFAKRDGRIRYVRQDRNRGASWNYNIVARETFGPYFKWATHDDLLAPTYLERCVEALDSESEGVVLAYPKTRIIDAEGAVVGDYEDKLDLREPTPHRRLRSLIRGLGLSNAAFGLIRRSALEQTRLLASFPASDYVMLAELALLGEFHEVPERLFFRREHEKMSRRAHRSGSEAAEWFEPGSGQRKKVREFQGLLVEHVRSIHRMPLGARERVLCDFVFLATWVRTYRRFLIRELLGRDPRAG
jgi:glycosyltransferase involved in cell wall biosynthesis